MKTVKWKPKEFDIFFYLSKVDGKMQFVLVEDVWVNSERDKANRMFNNCFRTKSEAAAKMEKINAAIKSILHP